MGQFFRETKRIRVEYRKKMEGRRFRDRIIAEIDDEDFVEDAVI